MQHRQGWKGDIRDWIEDGMIVFITGSKFFSSPHSVVPCLYPIGTIFPMLGQVIFIHISINALSRDLPKQRLSNHPLKTSNRTSSEVVIRS